MKKNKANIPTRFNLLASTFTITIDNDKVDSINRDALGIISPTHRQIYLKDKTDGENLPIDTILDTYYHEVTHAILNEMGEEELKENEKFVDLLGKLIRQFIETSN